MALQEIALTVEGMGCEHCKKAVEESVKQLKGISGINVNLQNKKLTVSFEPDKTNEGDIIKAVEKEGYRVIK